MTRSGKMFVVGCGSIGRRHIKNLRSLGIAEITAFDPDEERMRYVASEFGVAPVESVESGMVEQPQAVIVCTPPSLHMSVATTAIDAGVSVFMEKPIADLIEGVEKLIDDAAERKLVLMVGYNLRFLAALQKVKAIIDEGGIGRVMTVRAEAGQYLPDWRPAQDYRDGYIVRSATGGGIVLDGSHELDYVRWLVGEPESVYCIAGKLSDLDMETEDTALILMRHSSGVMSEVHLDCTQRGYSRGCKVVGTKGTLSWSFHEGVRLVDDSKQETVFPIQPDLDQTYVDEMDWFLSCLNGEKSPPVGGREGMRVLEVALAAKESARTHQEVVV